MVRRSQHLVVAVVVLCACARPTMHGRGSSSAYEFHDAPVVSTRVEGWLVLSDIHFNPFDDPAIVDSLAASKPDQWGAIFQGGTGRAPSAYGTDTNYLLWSSTVAALQQAEHFPRVILIAGDLLGHNFRALFDAAAKDHSQAAYESFVDKTIAFLALELGRAFPETEFLPAVGNTDSYCGDYAPSIGSPFFAHMAAAWEPLVNHRNAAPDFVRQFSKGGYYTVFVPWTSVRVVVANSVFWSAKYSDRCAAPDTHPGADELEWLKKTLTVTDAPRTWILTHIPPGMDARASAAENRPVSFYDPSDLSPILNLVDTPAANVRLVIAGHTHGDSFRLTRAGTSSGNVPIWLAPSVSPIFKNNPAFFLASVAPDRGEVVDYLAYALDDAPGGEGAWRPEYRFTSATEQARFTPQALSDLRGQLATDAAQRARFEEAYVAGSPVSAIDDRSWRAYWCAIGSMTPDQIKSCLGPP